MTIADLCRRTCLGILGTAFVAVRIASANELGASCRVAAVGFTIHDADETLRSYCRRDPTGRMWFTTPGGASFELVTSVDDPSIVNKGDGQFHVYDAAEVRATIAAIRYPLDRISADVFILPYPRAGALESAAGPGLILLAPGVRPLSPEHQHAELTHEIGHVVQYARMPDADAGGWNTYRALRGIEDRTVFFAGAPHAFRPHEIFAEDFRALFGDPLANYSQTIENSTLTPPAQIAGLSAFLQGLTGGALPVALAPSANPARGGVEFTRSGPSRTTLELFDVAGRRIATVEPVAVQGGTSWRWNGLESSGRAFAGTAFARLRGEPGAAARVTLLP